MIEGRITSYNPSSRTGQINDHDENEYRFTAADWRGRAKPVPGARVRFESLSGKAYNITVLDMPALERKPGARKIAWITVVIGLFFALGLGGQIALLKDGPTDEDLVRIGRAVSVIPVFLALNIALAGYAIGRGPRGRIVACVSVVFSLLILLVGFGTVVDVLETLTGISL